MIAALCLLALSFTWPGLCQEADVNLLVNPGFEDGGDAPDGWSFNHRRTDGKITWDDARAHSGGRSVRLRNAAGQTGNVVQTLQFDPALPPGSVVTCSAWAATEDVGGSAPRIMFNLMSADNVRQDAASNPVGAGTHDFAPTQGVALADRVTSSVVIYLCHYGTGTAWWDDAVVTVERAAARSFIERTGAGERLSALETGDGLALTIADNGGVAAISVAGDPVTMSDARSGLWIAPVGGDTVAITGEVTVAGGGIAQGFVDEERGLRVRARYRASAGRIECEGEVVDLTGEDRGVDVIFSLPVDGAGLLWGRNIRTETPVADTPLSQTMLTFASLSNPETGQGLALAVPADSPCECELTWGNQFGFAVRYRFGLSPDAGGDFKSRAPFRFVVYRCDGKWGLRDAARRYYATNPAAFEKRVEREGLWLFGSPRIELPDPENYAFHEGGPRGWEFDEEHGIYTYPYIIPGQREIRRLEKLPASRQEALAALEAWENPTPERGGGWGAEMRDIITSCLLQAPDGLPQMSIRTTDWGGDSVTFPLNANPNLFADTDAPTIGKSQLATVAAMHDDNPKLDGTYVDSLGAWGNYNNYRAEHFAYTQTPLSFDPTTRRSLINNRFTLLEFLWDLGDLLHERGDLLFANGVHQNRRFHAFACDVMGVEGHNYLEQKRAIAAQKPFLLLIYGIQTDPVAMEHWFNLCGFYGIYPSFGNMSLFKTPGSYAPVLALNNKYVPTLQKMTGAGWQAVTYARSSDPEVWLERWGPGSDGAAYLTVYNSTEDERAVTVTVASGEMGLAGDVVAYADELSDFAGEATVADGAAVIELAAPAERLVALRLTAQ
jgi:hypothetical protein